MKTPKEILFARHRSAEAKLDEVRETAVAAVYDRRTSNPTAVTDRRYSVVQLLRDLLSFKPQTWAGLTAVWVLIFALKLSTSDTSHIVAKKTSVSPQVIAEVRQQKLFFAELAGLRETRDAEPPKLLLHRPRSERHYENLAV